MLNEEPGKQGESETPAEAPVDLDAALHAAISETFEPAKEESESPSTEAQPKVDEIPWDKFDLEKAPQEVKERLYKTFQPNLQKRVDELAARQQDLYDRALLAWEQRNAAPPPVDIQAKLKEAIESGDLAAVAELSTAPLRAEIGQIREQLTRQQALDQAVAADPNIPKNEAAIAERLKANPVLLEMSSVAGHKFAPFVLQGVNAAIERDALRTENAKIRNDFKAAVDAAVKADRAARTANAVKLGPNATQAGTKVAPQREADGGMPLGKAMELAWEEANASRS